MTGDAYFATGDLAASTGVRVGHWTDEVALTGCTVIRFDAPVRCVVDVRGGAPATRETDLLAPGRLVRQADALLFTGGSAFGLAAADGVMRALREDGRGVATPAGPVPIIPTAAIFDLAVGRPAHPDDSAGYAATRAAVDLASATWGRVGAGRGATVAKITGAPLPGGIGLGEARWPGGRVQAIAVVNALGVISPDGGAVAAVDPRQGLLDDAPISPAGGNTTLVALLVDAPICDDDLLRAAVSAHDGIARAIVPAHTAFDGDIVFAASLRPVIAQTPPSLAVTIAAELAVERAIRAAVRQAPDD
jgi:L-aminopeptidase/D-esterase-like protein